MARTADVIANTPILSAWGNEIRDRTLQVFTNAAERDSQWVTPPNGAHCITLDNGKIFVRMGGAWYTPFSVLHRQVQSAQITGIGTGGLGLTQSPSLAIPAGRRLSFVAHYNFSSTSGGAFGIVLMDNVVVTPNPGRVAQLNLIPGQGAVLHGEVTFAPAAGNHTFNISWAAIGASTATLEGGIDPGYYEVRDIGAA